MAVGAGVKSTEVVGGVIEVDEGFGGAASLMSKSLEMKTLRVEGM